MIDAGAQLVEVLPEAEYREAHLPGAVNIPLKRLAARERKTATVTTPEGVLFGVVRRRELEAALTEASERPATA